MKKRIALIACLVFILACIFALSANAQCDECTDNWTLTLGEKGYLGKITAVNTCPVCNTTLATEWIDPMFETLGYSYSGMGGITQHYAVNRAAVARYEELAQETVKFGAVAATRNHVSANPFDDDGNPVSDKISYADFTSTEYDVFDVIVNGIPEDYRGDTEIICCAYIIAGGKITYIDNGVEKKTAAANTFDKVTEKVDNRETDDPEIDTIKITNGVKYKVLTIEEMGLTKWAYWNSTDSNPTKFFTGTSGTPLRFFATKRFTRDELPNGSMILVESGYKYRPEAWINDAKNSSSSRPALTSSSVVVDDSWWGSYTARAFNIATKNEDNFASTVTLEDIYNVFKICIPLEEVTVDVVTPPTTTPEIPFDPTEDTQKQDWDEDGTLKILCIGNSFSVDSMQYVYQVAEAAGVENIVLGNLYIGGCSLATHLSNATNDKGAYTYYTNTSGTWSSSSGYKISTAVQSDDWDFISLQQVSGQSGISDSYSDLEALINIVEPLNPSARLVWHMTWAYQANSGHSDFSKYDKDQMTMYNAIVNAVQTNVVTNEKIEIIIPAGTAIQNVRTSYVGDTLTRDGYHLSNDYGRYIGSLTFVKALTGLSIDNMTYAPDGVSENKILVAVEAVNNAVLKPFEVTASSYATEPETEVPDTPVVDGTVQIPEGYRQLTLEEMGWQASSYWNGKGFYHNSSDSFHNRYYATKNSFTKDDIPVGSIIILKQGENWQYRPDGWSGTRPGNVTAERVVVDDTWWGTFTNRVFNLSKTTNATINEMTPEEIYEILVILVPVEAEEEAPEVESAVTSDMCVSEVTTIDGVEYRALTAEAMGLKEFSYYWSENSTELWLEDSDTAKKFFSTGKFDQSILVNGAVIWVGSGWQYRPEGWIGTELNSTATRPANTSATYTTVTNDWWGSFTTRAFNISMNNTPVLDENTTVEDVYEIFKIYIPVDKIAE